MTFILQNVGQSVWSGQAPPPVADRWQRANGMDTSGAKRRHKRWPEALKREIVAATLVPGASVSVIARQYRFSWRRRYRDEPATPSSSPSTPGLEPVTITRENRRTRESAPTIAARVVCGDGTRMAELRLPSFQNGLPESSFH